jgi:glycosyltransferase involved in cell wall biosynthesis
LDCPSICKQELASQSLVIVLFLHGCPNHGERQHNGASTQRFVMHRLCWVLPDVGNYHHARFETYARKAREAEVDSFIIEVSGRSEFHEFRSNVTSLNYKTITLFPDIPLERISTGDVCVIWRALDRISPQVVCVPGWGGRIALATLYWCLRAQVPAIVMSETQAHDFLRVRWKESLKRRLVGLFSAAMVGGTPHRRYVVSLGMEPERIHLSYDVVDNDHFYHGASRVRRNGNDVEQYLNLPANYFMSSCRFIPKKNLMRLIHAYHNYRKSSGFHAWKLLLLGDGPLMPDVLKMRAQLNLGDDLILPGFQGYDALPAYYRLADVFILASTSEQWGLVVNEAMAAGLPVMVSERCGSAADLVRHGENGFVFDPYDEDAISNLMLAVSSGTCDLAQMGRKSREIISGWTTETFAENLSKAAECAVRSPRLRARAIDKFLVRALMHR